MSPPYLVIRSFRPQRGQAVEALLNFLFMLRQHVLLSAGDVVQPAKVIVVCVGQIGAGKPEPAVHDCQLRRAGLGEVEHGDDLVQLLPLKLDVLGEKLLIERAILIEADEEILLGQIRSIARLHARERRRRSRAVPCRACARPRRPPGNWPARSHSWRDR